MSSISAKARTSLRGFRPASRPWSSPPTRRSITLPSLREGLRSSLDLPLPMLAESPVSSAFSNAILDLPTLSERPTLKTVSHDKGPSQGSSTIHKSIAQCSTVSNSSILSSALPPLSGGVTKPISKPIPEATPERVRIPLPPAWGTCMASPGLPIILDELPLPPTKTSPITESTPVDLRSLHTVFKPDTQDHLPEKLPLDPSKPAFIPGPGAQLPGETDWQTIRRVGLRAALYEEYREMKYEANQDKLRWDA